MHQTLPRRSGSHAMAWLALAVLLAGSWHCLRATHRGRRHARPAALPRRLQTWEGEGGRPDPEPAGAGEAAGA